jgi:hypothetical protein
MISSLGRRAATMAFAGIGPGPGRSPARPLARGDGSLAEDLAAPHSAGSARSSAPARQAVRSGHGWQDALARSSSAGSSENHSSPPPRWQGSGSASAAGGRAGAALEALGMTILGVRAAPFRLCAAGARGGTGRAGTAGELLGAHDVAVAWICRQRLEPRAGWMVAFADPDLLHRDSFRVVVAGVRSGPCALRTPDVRLRVVVPVSSVRPQRPGGHPPHSRSHDPGDERERPAGTPVHAGTSEPGSPGKDRMRFAGQPLRRRPPLR